MGESLLRRLRRERGWSCEEVATRLQQLTEDEIAVDAHSVGRWERGLRHPTPRYQRLLGALFDLPPGMFASDPAPSSTKAHDIIDDMRRRQLLTMMAAGVLGALDLEHLMAPQIEAELLPGLTELTHQYLRLRETMRVAALQPAVVAHLARLRDHLTQPMTAGLRRQVLGLAAETAILAGRNSNTLGNRGGATAFLEMARDLGEEAGAATTVARVTAIRAGLFSANSGGRGDSRLGVAMLDAAWERVRLHGDDQTRTYVLALRSEQRAGADDGPGSDRDFAAAVELMDQRGPWPTAAASPRFPFEMQAIDGNRLGMLRRANAIPTLDAARATMEREGRASWAATIGIDRAVAMAALGEVEGACRELIAAWTSSLDLGAGHNVVRIEAARRHLPDCRATRELDALLAG